MSRVRHRLRAPGPQGYLDAPEVQARWLYKLQAAGLPARVVPGPAKFRRRCWCLRLTLDVEGIGTVKVTICLPRHRPEAVLVYVTGPMDSKHRYADGALCMWFPGDLEAQRWTADDGPVLLVGVIKRHLFLEEWWRRTGDWAGHEAPHDPLGTQPR